MAESSIKPELASRILRTVPYNNAFYFFTDIGQYDGKFAVNLADFCQKIKTINVCMHAKAWHTMEIAVAGSIKR